MKKNIFCENYKGYPISMRLHFPFDFYDISKNGKFIMCNLLSKQSAKIRITKLINKTSQN